MVHADHPEAAPLVKSEARGVLREDARHDLPEAPFGVGAAERLQRFSPRSRPAGRPRHVHRMLGYSRVGGATAGGSRAPPCHHPPSPLYYLRAVAVPIVDELRGVLFRRAWLRLERRDPVGNTFVV